MGHLAVAATRHPRATYTIAKDALKVLDQNPLFRYYMTGRLAFGIATGLGPAASLGDALQAVEKGHDVLRSFIQSGIAGIAPTDPGHRIEPPSGSKAPE